MIAGEGTTLGLGFGGRLTMPPTEKPSYALEGEAVVGCDEDDPGSTVGPGDVGFGALTTVAP